MKKVKFTCDWCSDYDLKERVERAYCSSNTCYNFDITLDDACDLIVSINKPVYDKKTKTLGVLMEPSWFLGDKKYHIYNTCDHVLSYNKETPFKNNIFYPGLLPMQLTYNDGNNVDYFLSNTFNKSKTCSMVVSRNKASNRDDVLYNKRIQLAELILQTDLPIDIYGSGWDPFITKDSRVKGSLDINRKFDGLQDYKFSIAIENTTEGDYFTEKVTDCLLVDTVPLYYGCENINRFFASPHQLSSCTSIDEIAKIIKDDNYSFNKEDKLAISTKYNLLIAVSKYLQHIS